MNINNFSHVWLPRVQAALPLSLAWRLLIGARAA
jgi:hypothetical protein